MGNLFIKNLLLAFVSLIILTATLYIPVKVDSQEAMRNVRLGYPLPFINQSLNYNPPTFPRNYSLSSVWENPIKVDWANALLSFAIIFLVIYLVTSYKNVKL